MRSCLICSRLSPAPKRDRSARLQINRSISVRLLIFTLALLARRCHCTTQSVVRRLTDCRCYARLVRTRSSYTAWPRFVCAQRLTRGGARRRAHYSVQAAADVRSANRTQPPPLTTTTTAVRMTTTRKSQKRSIENKVIFGFIELNSTEKT